MSAYPEQPFSDFEERYFLAEILKKSTLSTTTLINIIRDSGIDPAWNDIALPNGRSVSSCQQAYNALLLRTQQQQQPQQPQPPPPLMPIPPQDPSKRPKRPYSMGDVAPATPLAREIQPRPTAFSSVNGQSQPLPGPVTMSPVEPPRKKRGRPTKSEFERRQAEARERGEVWPRPRNKPKAQRPAGESAEGASSAAAASSSIAGETVGEGAGSTATVGSGEESSIASTAPTAMMYPPGTPSSAPPSSPAGQRRAPPYEGMMPPAGQVHQSETRPLEVKGSQEARLGPIQPSQGFLTGPIPPRGPPAPQQRPSQGQFQPPYGSPITSQYQAYHLEDRPPGPLPGPRQQQQ